MDNFTNVTLLTLEGYVELEKYRYVYFVISLAVYLLIICCNSVIVSIIYSNKCLHEPMYIFIAALLCNALCGTSGFYPKLLIDLLSERPAISYEGCIFQAFWLYTYAAAEFTLLSAMAYDRYVSICKPLQYASLIKMSTVRKLLFICWFWPSCQNSITVILIHRLQLCKYRMMRIYCSNYAIVKLSCGDITANNLFGLFNLTVMVFPPVIFVIYSYIRILDVCLKNSKDFRRKALQTCFPHLTIFIIFTVTACFEVINSRLEGNVPHLFAMIMSVENLVIPPLLNPVIYGLKMQEIFNRIKKMLQKRKTHIFTD
ncbi:olfactory receptor 142-like [Astyanax mexicanus]|uniref:olfactory receptor 142-like n=1 Tax=Astyanax mexicanus TaxID=7994 RepID=UPI0020CAE55D|nr:olfactory receptor 142-like [Astyanax mexicanus]